MPGAGELRVSYCVELLLEDVALVGGAATVDDKSRVAAALEAVALNGDRKAETPIDIEERVAEEKRRSITAVEKKDARVLEIFIPNYVETRVC